MRIYFTGDLSDIREGLSLLANELKIELAEDGLPVHVAKDNLNSIRVSVQNGLGTIRYSRKIHFFRALGLLVESLSEQNEFTIIEQPQFRMNGPMFDVSQGGAVMKVDTVKAFLRKMAIMGLDMIMLYAEDSFDVKEQPYFGYMRGRYSQTEIKEMDDYAYQLGIEMIPCIQTLSHLEDVLKWRTFDDLLDDKETLLVGYERTYEFIEQLIIAASSPVRTKRIHIGMDEAWHLGLGKYLIHNGLRSKDEIMSEHLRRVLEITDRHGLQLMMWSDMFFRAGSATNDYYDRNIVIPERVIAEMPKEVQLIYWDYHHTEEDFYTDMINRHKQLGSAPIFAGGIWNWKGYCLNYGVTFEATNAALSACKREGVSEIIATLWGDDGTECDWFAALLGLQLFAEHGYAADLDEQMLRRRFQFCTGAQYDDFMEMRLIDETPGISPGNLECDNRSRYVLWQNVLTGLFDRNIRGLGLTEHYAALEERMAACSSRNGEYDPVFELLRRLCTVLKLKAELGLRLTDAYQAGSKSELAGIANSELPSLTESVKQLHAYHRERWHKINKPFGWDIMDLRYGGLLLFLDTAQLRLLEYVNGTIERLEELEEERLLFESKYGMGTCSYYQHMVSASRIARI